MPFGLMPQTSIAIYTPRRPIARISSQYLLRVAWNSRFKTMTERADTSRTLAQGLIIAFVLSFGPAVSNSFARFGYALVLPAMRADLNLAYAQAGWLNTANAIGYLAGALLTRAWVVQVGNRTLFLVGMLVTSLAVLATGLSSDITLLSLARFAGGLGGAAVFICGGALSANVMPDRPQLATTTIAIYFAGGGIGLMVCGVSVPWLLEHSGTAAWPTAWIGMGMVAVCMTLATIWAASRIDEPAHALGDARAPVSALARAGLAYLCFGLGYIGYMTFVIAWVREQAGSTTTVMFIWTLLGFTTLLAPTLWRGPMERWPGGWPMAASMLLLAFAAALPLWLPGMLALSISAACFGAAMFSIPAAIQSLVKKGLPKPAWGSAMAVFTVVFAAGQIVGPVATGWLADRFGSLRPGLAISAAILFAGAFIASRQREVRAQLKP